MDKGFLTDEDNDENDNCPRHWYRLSSVYSNYCALKMTLLMLQVPKLACP